MSQKYYAPRGCYEVIRDKQRREQETITHTLEELSDCPAYVLLGMPGIGKTATFKQEADQPDCQYVTARDFITLNIKPGWQNKTFFIDGLDEIRAGKDDVFSPFDEIRKKLDQLGQPSFRLSCREADWYGESDGEELAKVSADHKITVLFLNELTEEDLQQILIKNHHKTEAEASSFLEEARRRELIDLIKNPQILKMLVVAVGEGNEWPERKVDIFRLACEKLLLEEWNQTHNIANRNRTPPCEELMQASGMLCAVMLLARKQGFSSVRSNANDDYPFIGNMADDGPGLLQLVARTRLFTTHEGHTEYRHRIFAEYLSAYYLSNKIVNGEVPVGRVLALITGDDGGVVSEMRGVYAWLTTLCHSERDKLMQRDPSGVVLYGDASLFGKDDRLKLLHVLSLHAGKTGDSGIDYRNTQPFGALCQGDMEQSFRGILQATDYSERHQQLVEYVLLSMSHGKVLPGLSDTLLNLLKDPNCQPRNRKLALEALILFKNERVLQTILLDVYQNIIPDPDDDLLGQLLLSLYPERITSSEIFNYFRPPNNPNYIGAYDYFWGVELTRLTAIDQVAQLLDAFMTKRAESRHNPDEYTYRTMVGKLLAKGVETFGTSVETARLSAWLGLGFDEYDSIALSHEDAERIRKWLEQHPQIQKNLIEYHLNRCSKSENFDWCVFKINDRLFHADLPEDYGCWCLDMTRRTKNGQVAKYLFWQSVFSFKTRKGNTGLSLELIQDVVVKDARFERDWDEYRAKEIQPDDNKYEQERIRRRQEQDQSKKAFLQLIKNNLSEIETGTAAPWIFSKLGSAYYGYFIESKGDTPRERLNHFFQNDLKLAQSVQVGLRRFIHREDIPDVTDIIRLNMENKYLVYSHPYRAGMDELAETENWVLQLSEEKILKALAFYYADGTGDEPVWYKCLSKERTELAASVYVEFVKTVLRTGKQHSARTRQLAYNENYALVAELATLPLLEYFPARCTTDQLSILNDLLTAAIQHSDHSLLMKLIEEKLTLKSMNVAQRVYWVATGFILDSNRFDRQLVEFVSGKESRIDYFCTFLTCGRHDWPPLSRLSLSGSVSLIKLLGPHYSPYINTEYGYKRGSSFDLSKIISESIFRLPTFPTDEATDAIESMLELEQLTKWHPQLKQTLYEQRIRKREAIFQHASLEQVREALNNGPPANVADLACITNERLRGLAKRIKYGNTNDYLQYWEEYPEKRQHEGICRDRFLSALQPLLANVNVEAQREGNYVSDGRADIRVSFGGSVGYNVPIEIKCNNSKDLWHGIRKQLIERYTIDPGAHGFGIYLVFWFGYEKTTPHPESDLNLGTPAELEDRLIQVLRSDEERKKISVCVVDCIADGQPKKL